MTAKIDRLEAVRILLVEGEVKRLAPVGFHEALGTAVFQTGDAHVIAR